MTRGIVEPKSVTQPTGCIEGIGVSAAILDDRAAFMEAIRTGVSGEVVKQALDVVGNRELFVRLLGTTSGNLHRIYRRKALGQAQSEALLDTLRVFGYAEQAFGNLATAREWLETALPALAGQRPIDLCDSFEGRRLVKDAIRRIECGEFP